MIEFEAYVVLLKIKKTFVLLSKLQFWKVRLWIPYVQIIPYIRSFVLLLPVIYKFLRETVGIRENENRLFIVVIYWSGGIVEVNEFPEIVMVSKVAYDFFRSG